MIAEIIQNVFSFACDTCKRLNCFAKRWLVLLLVSWLKNFVMLLLWGVSHSQNFENIDFRVFADFYSVTPWKYALQIWRPSKQNWLSYVSRQTKISFTWKLHGETFYINFYYSIFQFRDKRITLRIFVCKNTKLYNNDIKLQHSS